MDLNIVTHDNSVRQISPTLEDKSMIDSIGSNPIKTVLHEKEVESPLRESEEDEDIIKVDPIDDKVIFGTDESEPEPVIKKVRSEKQREHLKKAREKALATRQAKAKVKKEEQEVKRLEREAKREEVHKLKVLKEEKDFQLKKKIESTPIPEPVSSPPLVTKQNKGFTEEDIIAIQQKAIDSYETKRKAEKKIRKEEESKIKQEAMIHQKIARAVHRDPNDDVWGSCFN